MKPIDNFQVVQGINAQWYWQLVDGGNGAIIAVGGEGFVSKYNAERAVENIKSSVISIADMEGLLGRDIMDDGDFDEAEPLETVPTEDSDEEPQERLSKED